MKLLKKIHKKEDKKTQFNNLKSQQQTKGQKKSDQDHEPFPWKQFFEEAQHMGMKLDLPALSKTHYKIVPPPASVNENAIFGAGLEEVMERQKKKLMDIPVPALVEHCVQYILKYGMREMGLFQPDSFNFDKIKKGRAFIDSGNGVDIKLNEHLKYIDVHTVAGLLKQYLRELPLSLIPSDVFDSLLSSIPKIDEVRKTINQLPRNSYNVLERVCFLLSQLDKQEIHNETNSSFLASCFGPVLMWRNAIVSLVDAYKTREIASMFIINYTALFFKGTTVRPALGQIGFQSPGGLSKSASLSTLSYHSYSSHPLYTAHSPPPSPSLPQSPSSSSSSSSSSPLPDRVTRNSVEPPTPNYMLQLYKNIKVEKDEDDEDDENEDDEDDENEQEEDDEEVERFHREMAQIASISISQPSSPSVTKRMSGGRLKVSIVEEKEEREKEEKGKQPMMLRKTMSEDLTIKPGPKKGLSQFFKKMELKKKP